MLADLKAHNIPGQRNVKLNELAKQILTLLPLLPLLLLLMCVLHHALIVYGGALCPFLTT